MSVTEIHSAPWWPELVTVKDGLSWAALEARYGVRTQALRAALEAIGETKAPQPRGRKKRSYVAVEAGRGLEEASEASADVGELAADAGELAVGAGEPAAAAESTESAESAEATAADSDTAESQTASDTAGAAAPTDAEAAPTPDPLTAFHAVLGTRPDAEVATMADVPLEAVKAYRREHGIAPFLKPPPGMEPPALPPVRGDSVVVRRRESDGGGERRTVRQAPPVVVAEADGTNMALGANGATVQLRHAPGVAAAPQAAARLREPVVRSAIDAWRHLVGVLSDAEVAEYAEVSDRAVLQYRKRHGIAAPAPDRPDRRGRGRSAGGSPAPAAPRASLGVTMGVSAPPASVAADTGASAPPASVAADGDVSTPPASVGGDTYASTPPASVDARPSAQSTPPKATRNRRSALDAWRHLVGKVPDAEVARRVGLTTGAVLQYRQKHGIPAAGRARAVHAEVATTAPPAVFSAPAVGEPTPPTEAPVPAVAESSTVAPALAVASSAAVSPPAAPAAAASPMAVPATSGQAFGVRARNAAGDRRFVVVATNMVDAATRATAALAARSDGPWTLQSVRVLCEALG